jgi:quinol monooxygenase YgiN
MAELYTLGEWTARPGREDDLVAAWQDLAEWTADHVGGSGWAKLLRDHDQPRRFISFGPWQDADAVAAWRADPGFRRRVDALQELVEGFSPHTMDVAAQAGPATPDP